MDSVTRRGRVGVLVVDDNDDHRMLMSRALADDGFEVTEAATPAEALTRASAADLVLLDYRLPGASGLDVLAAIRSFDDPPSVVLITAQGGTETVVEAMRGGAIDYVTKDVGYLAELPTVVRRAWRQHDLARRTKELQRLALLVTDADDVDEACDWVVRGVERLLRARSVVLALDKQGVLVVQAQAGEPIAGLADLLQSVRGALPPPGQGVVSDGDAIVVTLPGRVDEPLGVLVVVGWAGDEADVDEELELAKAFGAFAGTALRNLRRHDLEQSLIAELQRTIEARRDFIASVSHELRTPLTSIGGYTETVLTRWEQLEEPQKREFIGRVATNATHLGRLIEELIDLASMERGRAFEAHSKVLDLAEAVEDAVQNMEVFVVSRPVHLDVAHVEVLADPELLLRALANLISNAVKYSAPGSGITVASHPEEDAMVRLDVSDHGIGLSPGDAARVFEPFFRAGYAVANAVRGSGIGLALVREYARAMGGEVSVSSVEGHGSTFSLTLPVA